MLGTTPLNSILFADFITFDNEYMKNAHARQRMSNNNNNNTRKQVRYFRRPGLLSYAITITLKFKLK